MMNLSATIPARMIGLESAMMGTARTKIAKSVVVGMIPVISIGYITSMMTTTMMRVRSCAVASEDEREYHHREAARTVRPSPW